VIEPLTESQQSLAVEAISRADRIARRYTRIFPEHEQDFKSSALWGSCEPHRHSIRLKGKFGRDGHSLQSKGRSKTFSITLTSRCDVASLMRSYWSTIGLTTQIRPNVSGNYSLSCQVSIENFASLSTLKDYRFPPQVSL
jgi:hypothetical protein